MLEGGEVNENLHVWGTLGLDFGAHFLPLDLILEPFGGLDAHLGPFLAPWRSKVPKLRYFDPPQGTPWGPILDTFWIPRRKRRFKNMKKSVSGSGLGKKHFTNRAWRGPKRHPIDTCRCFREVRWDALGSFWRSFWISKWTLNPIVTHFGHPLWPF